VWGTAKTAREVALVGMNAGCEFDKNSGGPIEVFTLKSKK
jgi:ATP-dependent HslUV protease, peptidase subunit HslV